MQNNEANHDEVTSSEKFGGVQDVQDFEVKYREIVAENLSLKNVIANQEKVIRESDSRTAALTQQVEKVVAERNKMRDEHHGMIVKCEIYEKIVDRVIERLIKEKGY